MIIKIKHTLNKSLGTYRESYLNTAHIEAITHVVHDGDMYKAHLSSGKEFCMDKEYLPLLIEMLNNGLPLDVLDLNGSDRY